MIRVGDYCDGFVQVPSAIITRRFTRPPTRWISLFIVINFALEIARLYINYGNGL